MTALERAARAVEEEGPVGCCSIDEGHAIRIVRAVLMAVREPDEKMRCAGGRAIFERTDLFNPVGRDNWPNWDDKTLINGELSALSCYSHRAMIDAILNEKDTTND